MVEHEPVKDMKYRDPRVAFLCALLLLMISIMLIGLTFSEIPQNNIQPLNIVLGGVIAWTGNVIHFIVGSSQGSKNKD